MKSYFLSLCLFFSIISFSASSQSGTNVFDDSFIHEVRLTFQDTTFWDTLVSDYDAVYGNWANPPNFSLRKYVMAETIEIDGIVLDSVGLRLKGLSSGLFSNNTKRRHFKIDFGEFKDWKLDGVRKINLSNTISDGTMTKDAIIYDWFRDMGVPAPRTAYYKLYLNDEYWGIYLAVEQVDKNFLDDNFVLSDGNLYKPFHWNELKWYGPDWSYYEDTLELRTNEGTAYHPHLYEFLELINTATDAELIAGIDDVLDFDKYILHSAVDYVVSNADSPFLIGRNYYLYADEFNGKITTIPWDYNYTFAGNMDLIYSYPMVVFNETYPENVLRKRLQDNTLLRQMYFDKVCELGRMYGPDYFNPRIDEKINLIGEQILLEPFSNNWMPHSAQSLSSKVQALKNFIANNANRISMALNEQGYNCFLNLEEISESTLQLSPNPAQNKIEIESPHNIESITILNSLGQTVLMDHIGGVESTHLSIDCRSLDAGIYFVLVQTEEENITARFEKIN